MTNIIQLVANASMYAHFVSLIYTNAQGEKSRYVIQPGVKYGRLVSKSITALAIMIGLRKLNEVGIQAAKEILASFQADTSTKSWHKPVYRDGKIVDGLSEHIKTGELYIFGRAHSKVLLNGTSIEKPAKNYRNELTEAKDNIRKGLPTNSYKCFKVSSCEQFNKVIL